MTRIPSLPGAEPADLLAHDIRAAVSDVIGGLRLVDADALPPAARAQVERARSASEVLARLVEEAFAPSAGLAAEAPAEPGTLDLHVLLADELRRWDGHARPDGTEVTLQIAPDLPRCVAVPCLPMRRVIGNVMANATRHAAGGHVALRARLEGDTVVIAARDDGKGFDAELFARAFEPAVSGSGSTGLGLHIARAHAERMGGRLEARNLAAGGACVRLVLPAGAWRPDAAAPGPPDLRGWRVLVADDSETGRRLLSKLLGEMGAECTPARDGVEALDLLARDAFDLAIVDIEMPALGGLEVIRSERLRQARGIAPPVPLMAMTAYTLHGNRDAILSAGAEGILPKPIGTLEEVGALLAHHLAGRPRATWRPEDAPPLNAALLAELVRPAEGAAEGELLAGLKADVAAVEERLGAARSDADSDALAAHAHAVMSLAAVVGALPTRAAARALIVAPPAERGARAALLAERLTELRALLEQTAL